MKILLFLIIITSCCFANQSSYNLGIEIAKQKKQTTFDAVQNFNPRELPSFTDKPEASRYYGDVTQTHDGLKEAAHVEARKSPAACAVIESSSKRPIYKIDKNTEEIKKSQLIIDDAQNIVRKDGGFFCLNGECSSHEYTPSQDFEKSISSLSAMGAVQEEFDGHFIFKGRRLTCDNTVLGFNNCCRNTGWGRDIGLAHCSREEKKLGHDKEKGLTIYVGEYCSKRVLGVCLKRRKSYCSFPSKLARIVQEQGRASQLRIDFGSAEDTNCRGLRPAEMQRIDFSKIDFSEFYSDLYGKMKMPNIDATNERITKRIRQKQ